MKFKKIAFTVLMMVLMLPMLQELITFVKEPLLKGAYEKPIAPTFAIDSLKNQHYQKGVEDFISSDFGFRYYFIKTKNTLNYIAYKEMSPPDQTERKDGYIFSRGSIDRYLGNFYNGKYKNENTVARIKFLQECLENNHKQLFVVLAPSKESVLPEMAEIKNLQDNSRNTDYKDFVEQFHRYNVPLIDFCKYFQQMRDTVSYPLFTKTGFHWSSYGAALAQDSLVNYIKQLLHQPLPNYVRTKIEVDDTARNADADFEPPMNLFYSLQQPPYYYAKYSFIPSTTKTYKPKIIFIGDSYFYQIKNLNILKDILSNDSRFWYYFATSYPLDESGGIDITKIDVVKELESADAVVLVGNISTLGMFPYGVTDYYYTHLCNQERVKNVYDALRYFSHLFTKIDTYAKQNNALLEVCLNDEARRIVKHEKTIHLKAANGKFVCADGAQHQMVIANRDNAWLWETFNLLNLEKDTYAICAYNGKYFSTELKQKCEITFTRDKIAEWEIFTLVQLENNRVAFRAVNGMYLSYDTKTGQLYANAKTIGTQEKFEVTVN